MTHAHHPLVKPVWSRKNKEGLGDSLMLVFVRTLRRWLQSLWAVNHAMKRIADKAWHL